MYVKGWWRNGRRDRLKICWPLGRGGSSPPLPTLFISTAGVRTAGRHQQNFFQMLRLGVYGTAYGAEIFCRTGIGSVCLRVVYLAVFSRIMRRGGCFLRVFL